MKNLNAIIVDEERLARVNLRKLLEPFPEIEITGEATSCESALKLISLNNPHLVFLDIQLHGETCFDLLEQIDNTINIIFVSVFDENTIRSFKVNAVDYLTKPVNPLRLKEAIDRVIRTKKYPKRKEELYVI